MRFDAYEAILDEGEGPRHLADPRAAAIVAEALYWADGARYELLAWCVMPTHVHVLIEQIEGWPLHRVVGGWKSFSARRIGAVLDLPGNFWAKDYFDRAMRDERQTANAQAYIEYNPVKAGLCADPSDWKWSSAYKEVGEDADRPNGWRVGVLADPTLDESGASDGTRTRDLRRDRPAL